MDPRIVLLLLLLFASNAGSAPATPASTDRPTRFGVVVDDRYRSLEALEADETRARFATEAAATRERLASLPGRAALRARYDAIDAAQPPILSALQRAAGDRVFFVRRALGETTGRLQVREGTQPERTLLEPVAPDGRFSVSPDGRHVVVAQPGAPGKLVLIDVASGATTRVGDDAWSGAAPSWSPDGTGFYYFAAAASGGAAPTPKSLQMQLVFYRLADGATRGYGGWGGPAMPGDRATIVPSTDGRLVFVATQTADSAFLRVVFAASDGTGTPVVTLIDERDEVRAIAVHGTRVYARTMKDETLGRLVRYDATRPDALPVTVLAGSGDGVLQDLAAADDGLYVTVRHGFTMTLTRVPYANGASPVAIALPFDGSIRSLSANPAASGALFVLEGWTRKATTLTTAGDHVASSGLDDGRQTIGRDWVADNLSCDARDGTRVPMVVVHRAGMPLDGSHPAILNGYGGYGFVEPAYYYPKSAPWIDRDGVFAEFLPRGSGATGEAWHRAGMGVDKPHTWTDLEACARTLVARGYTSPQRLVIQGTGIGGLMVGRAMTDQPDLFAAVVMRWPITDALRFIESPAHRPADENELGRPDSAEGVARLLEQSVDAHIRDDVRYPAVLITTGLADTRFPPWMQLKTVARLEALLVKKRSPVLLRVDETGGASQPMTLAQRNDELADRIAFMLWIVGDPDFQPVRRATP